MSLCWDSRAYREDREEDCMLQIISDEAIFFSFFDTFCSFMNESVFKCRLLIYNGSRMQEDIYETLFSH